MPYSKLCEEDILKALNSFEPEKKKVFIQDLKAVLPQYEYDDLEDTCVYMANKGIINANINKLKSKNTIMHIKM